MMLKAACWIDSVVEPADRTPHAKTTEEYVGGVGTGDQQSKAVTCSAVSATIGHRTCAMDPFLGNQRPSRLDHNAVPSAVLSWEAQADDQDLPPALSFSGEPHDPRNQTHHLFLRHRRRLLGFNPPRPRPPHGPGTRQPHTPPATRACLRAMACVRRWLAREIDNTGFDCELDKHTRATLRACIVALHPARNPRLKNVLHPLQKTRRKVGDTKQKSPPII